MTIGIDASRANKKYRTGTEWYSYHLIKNLSQIDHSNRYILYTLRQPSEGLLSLGSNFEHKILHWPFKRLWTQVRLSGHIIAAAYANQRPDRLFVPAHTIPLTHTDTVTTCHDLGFERLPNLYPTSEKIYQRWSIRHAIKTARKIIAVSNSTRTDLMQLYGVKHDKIEVIYHGIDRNLFKPVDAAVADKKTSAMGLRPNQYLLYIGRLEAKKNTLGLIKSFQLLKREPRFRDWQLVLVGTPGYQFEKISDFVSRQEYLAKDIIFLGWLNSHELPSLLRSAGAFVFPSFYEGFGLPVLEAIACQCLVFASDLAAIREVAGESVIYFNPDDSVNMSRIICQGLEESSALKSSLQETWSKTLSRYSWEKCARETLSVLT